MKIYLSAISVSANVLCGIHTYLILTNQTTFECNIGSNVDYLRGTQYLACVFSRGCCVNVRLNYLLDDVAKCGYWCWCWCWS